MNKWLGISLVFCFVFSAGVCLGSEQTVADELFGYINLDDSQLAGVKQKYQAGQYADALDEYKDIFLDRVAELDLSDMLHAPSSADDILNNNTVRIYNLAGGYETQNIGAPGSINWYQVTAFNQWEYYLSNMSWANSLVERYAADTSANGAYLTKLMDIWVDFAQNNYDQWNAIYGTADQALYGSSFINVWLHRLILGDRIRYMLAQFSAAMDADATITKSLISGEQLGIILSEIAQRNMPRLNATIHGGVPNQVISSALGMMQVGMSFVAFVDAPTWQATGEYEAGDYLNMSYMPDGTDMEQSFNYNGSMISVGQEIVGLYQSDGGDLPVWINEYQNAMLNRFRFLSSIVRPNGMLPSLDLQSDADAYSRLSDDQGYFNDDMVARIIDNTWSVNPSLPAASFNSMYFPYGGYCIFRDGWDSNAHHMFMKNSRMGKGHYDESSNQVQITAFGRTVLIDSGGQLYVPDYRNEYFHGSFGHNTIIVDGKGQVMGGEHSPAYDTTIDARFHTSDDFDMIEGSYGAGVNGGYGSDGAIEITDVTHKREVTFVKGVGVYVIADRLLSTGSHTYTQIWNYDKDYAKTDVNLAAANKIITTQAYQPNVAIYNFSPVTLSYTRYYGYNDGINVFGWAKDGAGYVNAVDTHRSWSGSGDQLLISLVVPMSRQTEGISVTSQNATSDLITFTALADNGTSISYGARKTAGEITFGDITATAKSLLVITDTSGQSEAAALDCSSLTVAAAQQTPAYSDLKFTVSDSQLISSEAITKPIDFSWFGSDGDISPVYEQVDVNLTVSVSPDYVNTIAPAAGVYSVAPGTAVNLSADDFIQCPYVENFSHWEIDGQLYSTDKETTVSPTDSISITAVFDDARQCGDECHPILDSDLNQDCFIDIEDISIIADNWLSSSL
ncbi:MAG: heparinase II/III family protein [Sedimentisphaeraceae bacterium JB056]